MVNTKYYHASPQGRLEQGGVFSLDGVHPTAIGHGLIAHEFLKVMNTVGVKTASSGETVTPGMLNWPGIFQSDSLYSQPITLMQELYQHEKLAEFLLKAARWFG
jgi:hypothetical protein